MVPEFPTNKPLTPSECLTAVYHKIDSYLARGVCEACAVRLAAGDYDIDYGRVLTLQLERSFVPLD